MTTNGIRGVLGTHASHAGSWRLVEAGLLDSIPGSTPLIHRNRAINAQFVHDVGILHSARHLGHEGGLREAFVVVEGDGGLAGPATLCGHDDHTIRSAGTINGSGGVLQHGDGLDVLRAQAAQTTVAVRNSVDNNQRAAVSEGVGSPDGDGGTVVAGLAARLDHHHTRKATGERVRQVGSGRHHQVAAIHTYHRTSYGRFLLSGVGHHNNLVEGRYLFGHRYADRGLSGDVHFLGSVANVGNDQGVGTCRYFQGKGTLVVGQYATFGSFYHDRCADEGHTVLVRNLAFNLTVLGHCSHSCQQEA